MDSVAEVDQVVAAVDSVVVEVVVVVSVVAEVATEEEKMYVILFSTILQLFFYQLKIYSQIGRTTRISC